jgi:hypothetical protein
MMDDLGKTEFDAPEAEVKALDTASSPLLTNFILKRSVAAEGLLQENPVRTESGPGFSIPTSLFMLYVKFDDRAQLIARQFRFDDFGNQGMTLEEAELALLTEARTLQPGGAHYEASNFSTMVWRRPYYLTFVIDSPGWEFYWHDSQLHEAIRLLDRKDVPGPVGHRRYEGENHTFFDADQDIPLPSLGDAFRVTNCFRDAAGPIEARQVTNKYCFEIYLKAPFKDPALPNQDTHITMLFDPDGQNQGPRT